MPRIKNKKAQKTIKANEKLADYKYKLKILGEAKLLDGIDGRLKLTPQTKAKITRAYNKGENKTLAKAHRFHKLDRKIKKAEKFDLPINKKELKERNKFTHGRFGEPQEVKLLTIKNKKKLAAFKKQGYTVRGNTVYVRHTKNQHIKTGFAPGIGGAASTPVIMRYTEHGQYNSQSIDYLGVNGVAILKHLESMKDVNLPDGTTLMLRIGDNAAFSEVASYGELLKYLTEVFNPNDISLDEAMAHMTLNVITEVD